MNKKSGLPLHWKILLGMVVGLVMGGIFASVGAKDFVVDWIKPFGSMFIDALKVIAVPLVIASLVKGVSDLKDLSRLSSMGGRTIGLYLCTTAVAVTLGLTICKLINPAGAIDEATRDNLAAQAQEDAAGKMQIAAEQEKQGPLQPLIDMVPGNIFAAASDNGRMLQVIVFVLFFSVGLLLVDEQHARPVKDFFDGLNEVVLKLIDLIMLTAPYGVFALMAAMVVESPSWSVFLALLAYSVCVFVGLVIMVLCFYPALVVLFTGRGYLSFFQGILPAQLLAFSTSSSAATLPVTMERVHEHLGVDEEVASFVLPIGATVNMDGTSLYQAVAAVFIAQAFGVEVGFNELFTIATIAMLASIGTAAVPSAGIVMLVPVLKGINVPDEAIAQGIALIFGVDRILDMSRTVANITSDATVSMLVAKSVGKLGEPRVKEWDDDYPKSTEVTPEGDQ